MCNGRNPCILCNVFSYIECFGAYWFNCSEPCIDDYFRYQCKNQCNCQNHEICNKYFGCQTISEFLKKLSYQSFMYFKSM